MSKIDDRFLALDNNERIQALHEAIEALANGKPVDATSFDIDAPAATPTPTFANVPDDVKTAILEMGEAMNALHGRFERQAEELSELRDFKARFDATMGDKS